VLCSDCHELYEMNKKLPRLPIQQLQQYSSPSSYAKPATYQTTQPVVSYQVDKKQPSKILNLPAKPAPASGQYLAFASAIILVIIMFIIVALRSTPNVTRQTELQSPAGNAPSSLSIGVINQNSILCRNPGTCAPLVGTLTIGEQVKIKGYTDCRGRWYHLDNGDWIESDHVNVGDTNIPYVNLGCGNQSARTESTRPPQIPTAKPRLLPTATPQPPAPVAGCPGGCGKYPDWCEPAIKGNISYNTGEKIYHVQGQRFYDDTVINSAYGERWFCTEQEAQAAGWRKSKQ